MKQDGAIERGGQGESKESLLGPSRLKAVTDNTALESLRFVPSATSQTLSPQRTLRGALGTLLALVILAGCGGGGNPSTAVTTSTGSDDASAAETQAAEFDSTANDSTDEVIVKPTSAETFAPAPTSAPSSYDQDGDGYLNWEELQNAIQGTIDEYTFPPNYQVTANLIIETMEQRGISTEDRWESQYQHGILVGYYLCGWEHALMDAVAAGNSEMRAEALQQLIDLTSETFNIAPSSRPSFLDRYEKAQLGDYSRVIRHLENSCSTTPFITPEG